ncbi:heavy metal translocating p-type ATPase [Alicycliphilus sp. B1]|nr:heavy metal translocating p-type ATPase [Alicycliphilus sp. B1]
MPGVAEADVSAATRRARVVWSPGQVLPSQWMEAVRKAGYRAMPAMDAFVARAAPGARAAARCGAGWWRASA